jgi:HEAT repeat protein
MSWHEKNKEFNELIKQLFHEKDWQNRAEAARKLGFMKDGRSVNLLCRALRSEEDKMVQNRIIEAMGRIGNGKATLRIIEKLREELDKINVDKFRLIYMIESLINIKDKRALVYIGPLLNSPDEDLKKLAKKAFDVIEPNWRQIIEREGKKSIEEIFKI